MGCLTILERPAPCHQMVMTTLRPGEDPAVALVLSLPAPPNADPPIAPRASGKAPIAALIWDPKNGSHRRSPKKYPLRTLTQNDITSNHESCELKSTYLLL